MKKKISILLVLSIIFSMFTPYSVVYGQDIGGIEFQWQRNFGYASAIYSLRGDSIPILDNRGNIYVTDSKGFLYCIDPNGELIYEANLNQKVSFDYWYKQGGSSPVVDSKGNAYIASADKNIYAFRPDGTSKWTYTMDSKVSTSMKGVLSPDEDTLYMADFDGKIYAVDTNTGELVWKSDRYLGYGVSSPILSLDGNTLYIASKEKLYAFNADEEFSKDYRVKWSTEAKKENGGRYEFNFYSHGTTGGIEYEKLLSLDDDGNIYLVSVGYDRDKKRIDDKRYLHKFNPDRTESWRIEIGKVKEEVTPPVYHDGYLYYTTSENKLYKLDPSLEKPEPQLIYTAKGEEYLTRNRSHRAAPIVKDGKLYTSFGKNIYVIDLSTEKVARKSSQDAVGILYISEPTPKGEIYATDGGKFLSKFKDTSVRQIPQSVEFKDDNFIMKKGSLYTPELKIVDNNGFLITDGLSPSISSSDEKVVQIEKGAIKAVGIGQATVFVDIEGVKAEAKVQVVSSISSGIIDFVNDKTGIALDDRLQLEAEVKINGKSVKGEKILFRSNHSHIASITESGLVTGISEGIAKIEAYLKDRKDISSFIPVYVEKIVVKEITPEEIGAALEKGLNWYRNRTNLSDWGAFAVNAAGADVNTLDKNYVNRIKKDLKENNGSAGGMMTDYERIAIGLLSAGQDITHFVYDDATGAYIDFVREIRNGAGGGIGQGINAKIWGLIALNAAEYDENQYTDTLYDKDKFIDMILKDKSGDGWAFGGGASADPDMTGMALYALAPYRDRQDVKEAGEKAFRWLSEEAQLPNGKFGSWGTVNSCSSSQAVMAIVAWGKDPQGPQFTKSNGNALTGLMSYYLGDGTFAYTSGFDPAFGTPQGIQALAAVHDYFGSSDDPANRRSDVWENIQYAGAGDVKIKSIKIRPGNIILGKDQELELTAITDRGSILENDKVEWTSSDVGIVEVEHGKILTLNKGEAIITAEYTLEETTRSDQIKITVTGSGEFEMVEELDTTITGLENSVFAFNVTNKIDKNINAVFMVNLFEYDRTSATDRLIQQLYIQMDFEPDTPEEIAVSFDIPKDNKVYNIKAMLWDKLSTGRSLNDYLEIKGVE
ncbi:MAG: PQQ-binding-like beta-propeller repeat protein [Tissierellaceae bacterium]